MQGQRLITEYQLNLLQTDKSQYKPIQCRVCVGGLYCETM